MKSLGLFGAALLVGGLLLGEANDASAQGYYYARRPVAYPVPSYSYYGGWYPGSYQNLYGNYGSYHVMTPYWNGGYRYRYW
ncbi:hypothetical protein [Bythopirellula polymerisocia]|uniref:Uncharacterized protein n=1 Tax=Bythopirellula polymerisocia TaxID=2528003 RepID=A0A5C6CCR3_9BACT|nr:hypothetical protein [Bythopirellula polymerisocia]TWU21261.1 hypothetical protein Pla144_46700 [Bythopirellula polymerisocia]